MPKTRIICLPSDLITGLPEIENSLDLGAGIKGIFMFIYYKRKLRVSFPVKGLAVKRI